MPADLPDNMPEDMLDRMPDGMSEDLPDNMPEDMPDRMPEHLPEDMPEHLPEDMPGRMPEHLPEDMPEHLPEDIPGRMPEDMPDRMPENMSDGRMPEDLPVTKCINVMVGITRSKVILHMLGLLRRANHWSWKADKSRPRKPYTGRPQRLRKTDTLRDSGSRSCCLLVYLHGGRGAKYNSNIFTSRMSQWLFSLLFIISLTVATGDPWQGQFHGNLTIANTDLVMANYDPWQDLTIPVLDPTRACTPRSFDMSFGCVSDQQMQEWLDRTSGHSGAQMNISPTVAFFHCCQETKRCERLILISWRSTRHTYFSRWFVWLAFPIELQSCFQESAVKGERKLCHSDVDVK